MKFSIFQQTHQGGRSNNEDRMGYCYTQDSLLMILADGMGGHPQGEVAAQSSLHTFAHHFQQAANPSLADPRHFLEETLLTAHADILRYAKEAGLADIPRTTFVGCIVQNQTATWIHCGDSRLYVIRDGKVFIRTRDHSYAEQTYLHLARHTEPTNRNVLFTCLGSPSIPVFDLSAPLNLEKDDVLLLCSDGLWDVVDESELVECLSTQAPETAIPALIEHALQAAGPQSDNITAVALRWESSDSADLEKETRHPQQDHFVSTVHAELRSDK